MSESVVKDDPLSSFRNMSLVKKCSLTDDGSRNDATYIVQMAVQASSQDAKVATACTDNNIHLFTRESLVSEGKLTGHEGGITDVRFSHSDPNLLYSSSTDQTVRYWDLRMKRDKEVQKLKAPIKETHEILCVDTNHSDLLLCAGTETEDDEDTHLLFWDRRASSLLGSYTESHDDSITRVFFKPGSDTLLSSAGSDGIVCVFDVSNTTEDDALQMTFNVESCVVGLGWCGDDDNNIFCTTSDHRFYAWDALQGDDRCYIPREKVLKEKERDYIVDCVPDLTTRGDKNEALLLTGSYSGSLSLLWLSNISDDAVIATFSGGHADTVRCLHWDAQTKTLLTGGEDSTLCLWSAIDEHMPKAMGKMKIKASHGSGKKKPYDKKQGR